MIFEPFNDPNKMLALSRLASSTADHLAKPISRITAEADILLRSDHRESKDAALLIRHHARQLATMEDCLRRFSGTGPASPQPFCVRQTLDDLTRMLRLIAGQSIKLLLDAPRDDLTIENDRWLFEEILCVLVATAAAHAASGTEVVLSVGQRGSTNEASLRFICLEAKFLAGTNCEWVRQFEPTFIRKKVGVSLGLASIYGCLAQLGGRLWVSPGPTTSLMITLPHVYRPPDVLITTSS